MSTVPELRRHAWGLCALGLVLGPTAHAAPLPSLPADHHGCVEAFTGTVVRLDVQEAEGERGQASFFYTEAHVVVESMIAGVAAETLRVVSGHSLRFHRDGFLDGYQDDVGGLVWFRTGDRVLIVSPLRAEDGSIDVARPFVAGFVRFFAQPWSLLDQPASLVVGYSMQPLLDDDRPIHRSDGIESLLNRVDVQKVESGETLAELMRAVHDFSESRCGERLFSSDSLAAPPATVDRAFTGPFDAPRGLAVRPDGDWVLVDEALHEVQILSPDGKPLFLWGGHGVIESRFRKPQDVAVDALGTIFVTDTENARIQSFNFGGTFLRTWGSPGDDDDEFGQPTRIEVGPDSALYVLDAERARIAVFTPRGQFLRAWGTPGIEPGQISRPLGLAVAPDGDVYISDAEQRVQRFSSRGEFILGWGVRGTEAGAFNGPADLCVDSMGRVLVCDTYNFRVQAFDPTGTFLGMWGASGAGNEPLWYPRAIMALPDGGCVVASGNTLSVFTINPALR